jgi:hypothetical protein
MSRGTVIIPITERGNAPKKKPNLNGMTRSWKEPGKQKRRRQPSRKRGNYIYATVAKKHFGQIQRQWEFLFARSAGAKPLTIQNRSCIQAPGIFQRGITKVRRQYLLKFACSLTD